MYVETTGIANAERRVTAQSLPELPAELLQRCVAGDMQAFGDVYQLYKRTLYFFACRFHGNAWDAEDALQETFVAIYRGLPHFQGESRFGTWAYRILLNVCIDHARKRKRYETTDRYTETEPLERSDAHLREDVLLHELIDREISLLPYLQKAVFLLFVSEGWTHPEIAEALNIGVGTSKSYYHRARKQLVKRLKLQGIGRKEMNR